MICSAVNYLALKEHKTTCELPRDGETYKRVERITGFAFAHQFVNFCIYFVISTSGTRPPLRNHHDVLFGVVCSLELCSVCVRVRLNFRIMIMVVPHSLRRLPTSVDVTVVPQLQLSPVCSYGSSTFSPSVAVVIRWHIEDSSHAV